MRGRIGELRFTGDYRHEPARPDRLNLDIPEAELAQIERLLMPTLRRRQGIFARLRLRSAPLPEWLRDRRLEGTVRIGKLKADDRVWRLERARLNWNGAAVALPEILVRSEQLAVTGKATVELAETSPRYRASGKISEFEFNSGGLAAEGTVESRGTGAEVLVNARAEGTFEGQNVAFSPEMEFGMIAGAFDWTPASRLRLRDLHAADGMDTYTGQGAVQADGRLLLELSSGTRQVKLGAVLFGPGGSQR
jgi:hypothetical protein